MNNTEGMAHTFAQVDVEVLIASRAAIRQSLMWYDVLLDYYDKPVHPLREVIVAAIKKDRAAAENTLNTYLKYDGKPI